jgi:hypothetical protein
MAEIGTTYAGQRRGPSRMPARGLNDEAERQGGLNEVIAESATLDDAKDLTSKFREAEAAVIGGAERPIEDGRNAIDSALLGIKERATTNVAASQMTQEQKFGQAVADALVERGIVPEPPSPVVADEYDEREPEEEQAEFFTDEAGDIWQRENGQWSLVQSSEEDDEPEPEDQWPSGYLDNTISDEEVYLDDAA